MRKGRSTTRGGLPCHISYGDLFAGSADVAVGFKASHAQCDASAHNDLVAGNCAPEKKLTSLDSTRHCGRLNLT